jgi:hypothetical protein
MPRGKAKHNPDSTAGQGTTTGAHSKMDAVRQALNSLGRDAKPPALDSYIREHFGMSIPHNMISSYKSQLRSKKKGGKGARRGRPPASESAKAVEAVAEERQRVSFKDLQEVKTLAGRLGIAKLQKLVEVLAP